MDREQALERFFGYKSFRPGQQQIITSILSGQDVLSIMPTGAGKSICFQLPALLLPGVTVVVSPLISLMKDQVTALVQKGIPACYVNGLLSGRKIEQELRNISAGRVKLIYVAPERLSSPSFLKALEPQRVSLVCVDEAHCVSQWGRDFRPAYLRIKAFIERLPVRPTVSAFTATATKEVQRDIVELVGLKIPQIFVTGFDRENLFYDVIRQKNKLLWLSDYLNRKRGLSGIVYCSTRACVNELSSRLLARGFKALPFHAGMTPMQKQLNQEAFICGKCHIIVATNAFGMGIDKPDVRFVIHYNLPADIEGYYQEAGRAGRDGLPSDCILLYDKKDIDTQLHFIQGIQDTSSYGDRERAAQIEKRRQGLMSMLDYCEKKQCLRSFILSYFGEENGGRCESCGVCLSADSAEARSVSSPKARLQGLLGSFIKGKPHRKELKDD